MEREKQIKKRQILNDVIITIQHPDKSQTRHWIEEIIYTDNSKEYECKREIIFPKIKE